jgi:MFS family permease
MNTRQASESKFRWVIISAAFIIMMVISIYQYSWFLFAYTIENNFAWNSAAIGMTFTVFAYAATFVQPFSGFIADSYGPRKMALAASFLAARPMRSIYIMDLAGWVLVFSTVSLPPVRSNGFLTDAASRPGWLFLALVPGRQFSTSSFRHYWIPKGSVQHFYGSDPACCSF